MHLQAVDALGRPLHVGDWVRLLALPPKRGHWPAATRRVFRRALGLTFRIEGFGRYGHAELDLSRKVARLETIWVEPNLLRRTRTRQLRSTPVNVSTDG
jgi:hypothetical protein